MLLDHAIEMLSAAQLAELVRDYVRIEELRPDGGSSSPLDEVRSFCAASLDGAYYEGFRVDSRNFMSHSSGTAAFIAECHRLLRLLCHAADQGDLRDAREGFELIFELLREIDRFERDILFFADEAGAWQIGVHWSEVLPAWSRCVAAAESPSAFASTVVAVIEEFAHVDRKMILGKAAELASAEHRAALEQQPVKPRR